MVERSRTDRRVGALGSVVLVARASVLSLSPAAAQSSVAADIEDALRRAKELREAGDLDGALSATRAGYFLMPSSDQLRGLVLAASERAARDLIDRAENALEKVEDIEEEADELADEEPARSAALRGRALSGTRYAVSRLRKAHFLAPEKSRAERDAAKNLRRLDDRWHLGFWRAEDDLEEFEREDAERDRAMRQRLDLGDELREFVRRIPMTRTGG